MIGCALDGERADMRERRLLRRLRVVEQSAGGGDGERRVIGAECGEIARAELGAQPAHAGGAIEAPGRQRVRRRAGEDDGRAVFGVQDLAGIDAREQRSSLGQRHVAQV